jgi:hypothetical protein
MWTDRYTNDTGKDLSKQGKEQVQHSMGAGESKSERTLQSKQSSRLKKKFGSMRSTRNQADIQALLGHHISYKTSRYRERPKKKIPPESKERKKKTRMIN